MTGHANVEDGTSKRDRVLKEALACRVELMAYARALLGDYSVAEDVVQEATLVVVRKYESFEEGTSMLAWCRSIVRFEVLRQKQQQKRESTLAQRLLDDAVDAAFDEFQDSIQVERTEPWIEAMQRCLERVPERSRRVLDARCVEDLSYKDIAVRVGMTLEAVRKALFRIRRQVRSCVETSMRGAQ